MAQDTPFTVVDGKEEPKQEQKQDITIDVDEGTAFGLKVQEFDKAIADAEAHAAALKAQKAAYIYQTNLNVVIARSKQQAAQAASPSQEQPK